PPELALALFIAPVLLDAAYDASPRDLKDNWAPITSLVVFAVGLTTAAVAVAARTLLPAMPWAAAIALGAVVAPPDAAAATAVLRQLRPPRRILTILEGESLLNDASALLIYRLAVGAVAVAVGTTLRHMGQAAPRTDPSVRRYRTGLLPRVRASKRCSGHGCEIGVRGSQRVTSRCIRTHESRRRWLRRSSARCQ